MSVSRRAFVQTLGVGGAGLISAKWLRTDERLFESMLEAAPSDEPAAEGEEPAAQVAEAGGEEQPA